MTRIIFYYLNFTPRGNGRIIFQLEGESQSRWVDLEPTDFLAIAAVLSQKKITYDVNSGTFISYNDDNLPIIDPKIIA